ncbi:MAG TPA: hypothetical protein VNR00_07210 [Opitutus sp.]|nr:hypothetical protein [Opitutus sp.]
MPRTSAPWSTSDARALAGGVLMKLVVLMVVLFAALALAWMLFLPVVFTSRLEERTGFPATVGMLVADPFRGVVEVRDFVLRNPDSFSTREFLRLREFRVETGFGALFSAQPTLDSLVIDMERVTLVQGDAGSNFQRFEKAAQRGPASLRANAVTAAPAGRVGVRRLRVKLGELVAIDESGRGARRETTTIGLDASYTDVSDLAALLATPELRPLQPALAAMGVLLPGELGSSLSETAAAGAEMLKNAGRRTGEAVKGFFETLEESKKP